MTTQTTAWNAADYNNQHSYIWKHGQGVVELLAPQPGERILDLGCGTGQLTQQIAAAGAEVVGIDRDPGMIAVSRQNYPNLRFEVADGADFHFAEPFDAVFSSAVLHWIRQPERVVACVWDALKPGGRFVAEFGGKDNIQSIVTALYNALQAVGYATPEDLTPWYYPSLGEYASLLERQGFRLTFAVHFDRPTPVEGGAAGMRNWLAMFAKDFLNPLPVDQREEAIQLGEEELRPKIFHDGTWVADYKRLRIVALRE